ncbi:MAG: SPOR domain-containing protein [Chitinophagaceae bacterium]
MKLLATTIFTVCIFFNLKAQKDTIEIHKDPRLDIISKKQVILNKRAAITTRNGMYKGYRLQVLVTNDRNLAFATKARLLTNYPTHKSYILFQSPNFKVRFGNFLKKEEAINMRKQLIKEFPQGVFIVDEAIEYRPVGDEDVE